MCGGVRAASLFLSGGVLSDVSRGDSAAPIHRICLPRADHRTDRSTCARRLEYVVSANYILFTIQYLQQQQQQQESRDVARNRAMQRVLPKLQN